MKAIRVHETGGIEKLSYEDAPFPAPGPGQVRVQIKAIGLNFIDVYFRSGLYRTPLPFIPGMEAAGVVDAIGENVIAVAPGDRVAYAMNLGSYAEYALVNAWQCVKLPGAIDFQTGAAVILQGMTAHYLAHSTFALKPDQTALVHAAAGGVGLLLIQICKTIGARVIGTVSTDEKARLAAEAGADHTVRYDRCDFEEEVKEITGGAGVDVVYDSVGRATFDRSLNCLKRRGLIVLFGQSSGPVPPMDLNLLNAKGSLFVTRPSLAHYAATQEEISWRAGDIFHWIADGQLRVRIDRVYPLREAAGAQQAMEGRETKGKVLLIP